MMTTRRTGTVSALAVSGLTLTLLLAHLVAPSWVRKAGLDLWNLPAERRAARETGEQALLLSHQRDRLDRSIEVTDQAVAGLVEGTLPLAEAVDDLSQDLKNRPGFETDARKRFSAGTFRRTVAAYLIDKAERLLADDPDRRAVVSVRLRAEFEAIK